MGYHVVDPTDIDPYDAPGRDFRLIGRTLGLETLGLNHVTARPGEQIPRAYHAHSEQEEALYVLEGEMAVETPEDEYHVEAGEVFVVEPGNPHRAYNPADADAPVVVLAIGAPSVDDAEIYEP